ncbi:hypothetical protein HanXRQr2_Chr13g0613941 [Helianthus annuus]|uniref:Uncharacterized protein n=1 Tax=Helianthus annuus TaxID=4232 RepID=A0A9K3EMB2_HELAN|nr:hypothetical protein HanXRQr2_Chr13g0613941 [Helianthus annuus]
MAQTTGTKIAFNSFFNIKTFDVTITSLRQLDNSETVDVQAGSPVGSYELGSPHLFTDGMKSL